MITARQTNGESTHPSNLARKWRLFGMIVSASFTTYGEIDFTSSFPTWTTTPKLVCDYSDLIHTR